jgi:hypothetical protein
MLTAAIYLGRYEEKYYGHLSGLGIASTSGQYFQVALEADYNAIQSRRVTASCYGEDFDLHQQRSHRSATKSCSQKRFSGWSLRDSFERAFGDEDTARYPTERQPL